MLKGSIAEQQKAQRMPQNSGRMHHRGSNGWGRMRRDNNLAELGITEEEFQEYNASTANRPGRDDNATADLAGASLAMGMDVDPALAGAKAGNNARPRNGKGLPHCHPLSALCTHYPRHAESRMLAQSVLSRWHTLTEDTATLK